MRILQTVSDFSLAERLSRGGVGLSNDRQNPEKIDLSWHTEDRRTTFHEIIGRFCVNLDGSIDVGGKISVIQPVLSSDLAAIFRSLPSRSVRECLEICHRHSNDSDEDESP